MLISHRKRFIYTKTKKTASTSAEAYFEPYCLADGSWEFRHGREEHVGPDGIVGFRGEHGRRRNWYNHMPAQEIRDKIGPSVWNAYFKFCVIRNPFDKLVSAFYFAEIRRKKRSAALGWKDRLKRLYRKSQPGEYLERNHVERFRDWIRNGGSSMDRDRYTIGGQICVDYFIRFEALPEGIKHVCGILDIPFEPERIPRLKAGFRNNDVPLYEYYDSETIEIVKRLYKFELETFGYSEPQRAHLSKTFG